jgi:hypothetical protein
VTGTLAQVVARLNAAANALGGWLLAPVAVLPGWLSATLAAAVTGVLLLAVFKYTSPQRTIKRVRDDLNAHLLALKLFKDSPRVALRAQGHLLLGAGRLFLCALVPVVVMAVPVTLLLGQLALWYQARPLRVGEEAVVTLSLGDPTPAAWPAVRLQPTEAVETTAGPVRVVGKGEVCWNIRAREAGYHRLLFAVGGQEVEKELAVGDGFLRVSAQRPGWSWSDMLLHPRERPLPPDSPVRSIAIAYPGRSSWVCGTDAWVVYWFVVSMISALCFRGALGVNV